jgi:hypothetical protein
MGEHGVDTSNAQEEVDWMQCGAWDEMPIARD